MCLAAYILNILCFLISFELKMAGKNPWISFLAEYRRKNPKLSMRAAMKAGAVEWRKTKAGGKKKDQKPKRRRKKTI
jgi:hypothetical protein